MFDLTKTVVNRLKYHFEKGEKAMKKRILSFVLMLSMLISLFTVFATTTSAASGDDSTPSPKSSGAGASYLDLYVKEGLVALFDGFGLSASPDAATEWKAVDLSGKE